MQLEETEIVAST